MKEIDKFYQSLMQDVVAMQSGDEDGNTQEPDLSGHAVRCSRNGKRIGCLR